MAVSKDSMTLFGVQKPNNQRATIEVHSVEFDQDARCLVLRNKVEVVVLDCTSLEEVRAAARACETIGKRISKTKSETEPGSCYVDVSFSTEYALNPKLRPQYASSYTNARLEITPENISHHRELRRGEQTLLPV